MASTAPSVTAIPLPSPSLPPNQTASASLPPLSATPSSLATITPPVGAQARDSSDANGHTYAPPTSASPQLNNSTPIDARVRNPVPSKLKGRIDGRNGNFSVMHMDLVRPDMTERDLAAKRSSEGTEAAARLANKEGYRPVKRTRWIPPDSHLYPSHPTLPPGLPRHPNTLVPLPTIPLSISPSIAPSAAPSAPTSATSIALSTAPHTIPMTTPSTPISVPAINSALPHSNTTPIINSPHNPTLSNPNTDIETTTTSISHSRTQLTPAETKVEQTRLLNLLPNLNPNLVVEHLCEALRHFGGVPGGPAPHDGAFPESTSNGPGSLFVGWVAEIFSQADTLAANKQDKTPANTISGISSATSPNTLSVPVKRGRGRPKGSTKKSKEAKYAGVTAPGINSADGSTMSQAMPVGAMIDASQLGMDDANGTQPQFPPSTMMEQNSDGSSMATPGGLRKRGRPKGSKNKPKSKPTDNDGVSSQVDTGAPHQSQCSMMDSPLAHKTSGQPGPYYATNEASVEPNLHIGAPHIMQDYSGHPQSRAQTNGLAHDMQLPSPSSQNNVTPRASTWKRKNSRHSQLGNQGTPEANDMLQSPSSAQNHAPTSQIQQQVKRRRVSREANQNLGPGGMDSQLSGPEILASPLIGTDGQPLSPAKHLRHGIDLIIQEEIHKQQHHQPPGMEQQSPNPAHGPSPGMQRNQSSRGQGPTQAAMSAPAFFQPHRQVPNHYGHSENPSERFGRNMGPSQFQQHMMNSTPGLGSQPPPPQSQQQQQPGRPSHPIGPFQGYADQPYLDMDYSGTPASFGGHAQLEAALAEPTVGERMFHTMGRR